MEQQSNPEKVSMKIKKYIALVVIGGLLGFITNFYLFAPKIAPKQTISSTVILERIESVSKLVTTEGYYANIYHIEDYYWLDAYPFKKQATIMVKLKALVGIDLSKIIITPDEGTKTLYIENIPDVEPIAIDPRIEFFDISEGMFNSFDKNDLNEINNAVRNMCTEAITYENNNPKTKLDSILRERYSEELDGFFLPLVDNARQEANKHIDFIKNFASLGGWSVVIKHKHFKN